ncbi:MAG TPA: hypothetical protein VHU19_16100 [Pyrinomonadaceae bacterium]|jgi:hypothetical protein|nr:hypothetical protein [Pyrinomonadaceae bacterium]
MPESNENDNKEQAEEFAYTTNVVTYILSAAHCPVKFRDYIDCLIGIAGKEIEFSTTDKQIESRRKVFRSNTNKGVNRYWARDKRRDLLKWQKENNLVLLDYKEGKYNSKLNRRAPSVYKLYLVEYVQRVIAEAKKNKLFWDSDRVMAIKMAAQRLIDELRARPKEEPEKDYIDPPAEVLRKLRTAKTHIEEAIRLLKKYDFQIYKEDEPLVASIEKLLSKIRERGFAELEDMKIFSGIEREPKP